MRLLIDTHIWLWLVTGSPRLSSAHRAAIGDPGNTVFFSVVSAWELGIKHRLGKLTIGRPLEDLLRVGLDGLGVLDVRMAHVARTFELPAIHRDPFDRMLIAQALAEGLVLVTVDPMFDGYGVPVLPA